MADAWLKTSSGLFGGWTSMRISLGMEQCANRFQIAATELWPDAERPRRILPWEACEVLLGDNTVITGYVDELRVEHNANDHWIEVTGRDKTADLVDCSAVGKSGQWRGLKIEQIAEQLAAPFSIKVRADVDTGKPLTSFALQEGETVFEAIERAARMRGVLLMSDGLGRLLITRAGSSRVATPLVLGVNVLSAGVRYDVRDRYSQYLAKGQAAGKYFDGPDASSARQAATMKATAKDELVPRYRPMIIIGECQDVAGGLTQRVRWEATVRRARSTDVQIDLNGWSHDAGLWRPNTLVPVQDPWLGIDDELLIRGVDFTLDEGGERTTLHLTHRDAYDVLRSKDTTADVVNWWSKP